MAILGRVSRRTRLASLATSFVPRHSSSSFYNVGVDEFFGLVGPMVIGNGSQTSDTVAVVTAQASIVSGVGSQTSDVTGNVSSSAAITVGQGSQTSDIVGALDLAAVIDVGNSSTADIVAQGVAFQSIIPRGWLDGAKVIPQTGGPFWRIAPRKLGSSVIERYVRGTTLSDITTDSEFTDVPWSQYVDGLGTPDVAFPIQYPSPTAIAPGSVGTPTIVNNLIPGTLTAGQGSQTSSSTGTVPFWATVTAGQGSQTSAVVGDILDIQITYPTGWKDDAFGSTIARNDHEYLTVTGIAHGSVGSHTIYLNTKITAPGTVGNTARYGVAHVTNFNRVIFAQGVVPKGFGTTVIYNLTQYKSMQGFLDDVFGTPEGFGPRYLHPAGIAPPQISVIHRAENYTRTVFPSGFRDAVMTFLSYVSLKDRFIYVKPSDDPPELFGAVVYQDPAQIIDCADNTASTGEVFDSVGIFNITRNTLRPKSILPGSMGAARVDPLSAQCTGFDALTFGVARVENYTRYVTPKAIGPDSRHGLQWVSFWVRNVYPVGWVDDTVWNVFGPLNRDGTKPGVYPGPITVSPVGFEGSGNTYDNCGFPRMPGVPRPRVT